MQPDIPVRRHAEWPGVTERVTVAKHSAVVVCLIAGLVGAVEREFRRSHSAIPSGRRAAGGIPRQPPFRAFSGALAPGGSTVQTTNRFEGW
jgi:hypothetical protein